MFGVRGLGIAWFDARPRVLQAPNYVLSYVIGAHQAATPSPRTGARDSLHQAQQSLSQTTDCRQPLCKATITVYIMNVVIHESFA